MALFYKEGEVIHGWSQSVRECHPAPCSARLGPLPQ